MSNSLFAETRAAGSLTKKVIEKRIIRVNAAGKAWNSINEHASGLILVGYILIRFPLAEYRGWVFI